MVPVHGRKVKSSAGIVKTEQPVDDTGIIRHHIPKATQEKKAVSQQNQWENLERRKPQKQTCWESNYQSRDTRLLLRHLCRSDLTPDRAHTFTHTLPGGKTDSLINLMCMSLDSGRTSPGYQEKTHANPKQKDSRLDLYPGPYGWDC